MSKVFTEALPDKCGFTGSKRLRLRKRDGEGMECHKPSSSMDFAKPFAIILPDLLPHL
jgi:hypothetical protein